MTSRLLAFALALIIGSPACWCCASDAAAPSPATDSLCCHEAKDRAGSKETPSPAPECPCGTCLVERDLADGRVTLPSPAPTVALEVAWIPAYDLPPVPMTVCGLPLVDESPPWSPDKIYLRDCRLLL